MNGKKVLITGSKGMLGSSLLNLLPCETVVGYDSKNLDISNTKQCIEILKKEKPDIIIHTAAYTNVEGCEKNYDKAYLVNTIGTQNLVDYCINKEVLFVYISSTGIYGSEKLMVPYNEFDKVFPTTIHHKSKLEAEKIVQNHLSKYLILRTGWLFGGDMKHTKNFVYKRYLEAKEKKVIYSDDSQIGNPTYVKDFVEQIICLIDTNKYGIFNCVNEANNISRYEYVKKIIELFGLSCVVKVAPNGMFTRIAPVSRNESAVNYKLDLLKLNFMGNWEEALSIYISELKEKI